MTTHLKHHLYLPNHEIPDPKGWLHIASHKTLCWTNITNEIKVTTDKSKVTCKKCIKKLSSS